MPSLPEASAPATAPRSRTTPRSLGRLALTAVGAVALLVAMSPSAIAQSAPAQKPGLEFLVSTGGVVPTGALRDAIKSGKLTAAQLSWRVRPSLAFTATFGWARTRDIADLSSPKVDILSYDVGAELRAPQWGSGHGLTFRPFAGVGAGARSYDYRHRDQDATYNLATYGSAGGELGLGRIRLRMELRDYVTGFTSLNGGAPSARRNDLVVLAGLRFVRR